MGIRGELFSTKVTLQNRTYFFNVKENRMGDLYLNIVESKNRDTGGFERQSVVLFADDLTEFLQGFDESLRVLEKAEREKRRGKARYDHPEGEEHKVRGDTGKGRNNPAKPKAKAEIRIKSASKAEPGNKGKRPRKVVVKRGKPLDT
ncbi:MAG: DUF3276 family protein [Treponema sp.]|jgi:hypothetical protein|nr:DUF3276 family protein [Treponema sp.]